MSESVSEMAFFKVTLVLSRSPSPPTPPSCTRNNKLGVAGARLLTEPEEKVALARPRLAHLRWGTRAPKPPLAPQQHISGPLPA